MAETQEEKVARWSKDDEFRSKLAATGNPFATLCDHCYGRHKAPRDKECPHSPPPKSKS